MKTMTYTRRFAAVLAALLWSAGLSPAAIRLGRPFGEHMVLQQGIPVVIWGTCSGGGEQVSVTFAGQMQTVMADTYGKWLVRLAPLKAGGPYNMIISENTSKLSLNDVLIGEVWLAAGPREMAGVLGTTSEAGEAALARYPFLRMYKAGAAAQWTVTSPDTAAKYAAAAYYFGRDLYKALHVPIGLIDASSTANDGTGSLLKEMLAPIVPYSIRGAIWFPGKPGLPAEALLNETASNCALMTMLR